MGTRSLTIVKEEGKTLATIYRQFDGYPTGVGQELVDAFANKTLVNGYTDRINQINGMGDLACRIIVVFKEGQNEAGGTYLAAGGDMGEEYTYTLENKGGHLHLTVDGHEGEWSGRLDDFNPAEFEAQYDE